MNMKYKATPELIATVRYVDEDGDDHYHGSGIITGVEVREDNDCPIVQLDLRAIKIKQPKGSTHLVIEIELHELVAAISIATMNSETKTEK